MNLEKITSVTILLIHDRFTNIDCAKIVIGNGHSCRNGGHVAILLDHQLLYYVMTVYYLYVCIIIMIPLVHLYSSQHFPLLLQTLV